MTPFQPLDVGVRQSAANLQPGDPPAPPADSLARQIGALRRLMYTNNPFYALSAALVFFGLRMSFGADGAGFQTWALMGGLAGYTLLLAGTACLLVWIGQVWDDIRTLLILVVLSFLAISVSFDDALAKNINVGAALYLSGLALAVLVSEVVLRCLRLSLPALFRLPYYAILGLFYLYPVAISPLLAHPGSPALSWALFGFSPVAGLVFLTLLPAIRRGPAYLRQGSAPWQWPWFPWVLFSVLGLGVCGRAFYLCVSLHFVGGTASIFGLYFLSPFVLCVGLLLLELGLKSRSSRTQQAALAMPALAMALAGMCHRSDHVYAHFLKGYIETLGGTPLFLTSLAAVAYYAFASIRRAPAATTCLAATLGMLSIVSRLSYTVPDAIELHAWPLVALAALQVYLSLGRWSSVRLFTAAGCLVAAMTILLQDTWFVVWQRLLPWHLLIAAALAIAAKGRDAFADALRTAGAAALIATTLFVINMRGLGAPSPPEYVVWAYPLFSMGIAWAYGAVFGSRLYYVAAVANAACLGLVGGQRLYAYLRPHVPGLKPILWGAGFFVLALLISLAKGGVLKRLRAPRTDSRGQTIGS